MAKPIREERRPGVHLDGPVESSVELDGFSDDPELVDGLVDRTEIEKHAYELWQARGCPSGSPDEDWFRAETDLRSNSGESDEPPLH